MKWIIRWPLLMACALTRGTTRAEPVVPQLHFLGIVGGTDDQEEFLLAAKSILRQPFSNRAHLGSFAFLAGRDVGKGPGKICYRKLVPENLVLSWVQDTLNALTALTHHDDQRIPMRKDCAQENAYDSYFKTFEALVYPERETTETCSSYETPGFLGQGKTKTILTDLTGDGEEDHTGASSLHAYFEAMKQMGGRIRPGDRVFLLLLDHGLQQQVGSKPQWTIHLSTPAEDGSGDQTISARLVAEQSRKLVNEGQAGSVYIHADACYAGGFVNEVTTFTALPRARGVVCGGSSASANKISVGNSIQWHDDFRTPLEYWGCFSTAWGVDRPRTSLDVEGWFPRGDHQPGHAFRFDVATDGDRDQPVSHDAARSISRSLPSGLPPEHGVFRFGRALECGKDPRA